MGREDRIAVAPCPNSKCATPIWSDHNDSWCHKCGEYFPDYFKAKLPRLAQRQSPADRSAEPAIASAGPAPPRALAVMNRYRAAYRIANTITEAGGVIKLAGFGLAILVALSGLMAASQIGASVFSVIGIISAVTTALSAWLGGLLLSAQGQLLLAALDQTVGASPFLEDAEKAQVMGLPTDETELAKRRERLPDGAHPAADGVG